MKRLWLMLFLLFFCVAHGQASVVTEEVEYSAGDVTMKGFLAYDDAIEGRRPGVLVVHEWWGHNAYARERAEMLAELGYTALAVDMYGDGKTADHPDDAGAFAGQVMKNLDAVAKPRFLAALNVLKQQPTVDSAQLAAIGYCFGGGTVLNMARMGVDLTGVVSFHGSLASPKRAEPGDVQAKILVCHGADDQLISPEQIEDFKEEMDEAQVDYEFKSYEGAKHSFTNPQADQFAEKFGLPVGYSERADQQSWQDMQAFFVEIFGRNQ
ncbi:MAG: dienelactone hydrolase family protein [Candidatus Omnitrophica bacterium]|nr:dienelactone hydrolase family protein [Candidatus Omnitrophota bacterium]